MTNQEYIKRVAYGERIQPCALVYRETYLCFRIAIYQWYDVYTKESINEAYTIVVYDMINDEFIQTVETSKPLQRLERLKFTFRRYEAERLKALGITKRDYRKEIKED